MKERLFVASAAVAAAIGLVVWGFLPSHTNGTGTHVVVPTNPPPPGYRLAFDPTFTGSSLDTQVWGTCYPWANPTVGCKNFGHKDEVQWYVRHQDRVHGGLLHLVAQPGLTNGLDFTYHYPTVYKCRSGMVTTYPSFKFTYGYVQVVAKIPYQDGLWSAFWLAAANKKWPPEIDLIEHWGTNNTKIFYHPLGLVPAPSQVITTDFSTGWHTFGVLWEPHLVAWYIDGHEVYMQTKDVPHQQMYLIGNLAESHRQKGTAPWCSGSLDIRSVKIWQSH